MERRHKFVCTLSTKQKHCFYQIINVLLFVSYTTLLVTQNSFILMDGAIWEHAVAQLVQAPGYK